MKLYVDLGNTAIKWASDQDLSAHQYHREIVDDLTSTLDRVWGDMPAPSQVFMASVRQTHLERLTSEWIENNWSAELFMSQSRDAENGLTNGYQRPGQLGVDRWLAMLAAWELSHSSVLVVDCGTATTLDAIDSRGQHLGGLILPGVKGFHRCLMNNTDLDVARAEGSIDVFATDTASAILSGAMLSHVCIIEKVLQQLQGIGKDQNDVTCILTGGEAGLLEPHLRTPYQRVPDLVLQGLAIQFCDSN
ncbi:MAG: type III pantothenate kinase [Candidatus Thiodiazotropha sp.]